MAHLAPRDGCMSQLQELGFTDFTGGLNVRQQRSFQVADNESPQMLNMVADSRLGIYTRPGSRRWNENPVTADPWDPRSAFEHDYADDTNDVFVTNANKIHVAGGSGVFAEVSGVACNAYPHLASFVSWGDYVYIATGRGVTAVDAGGSGWRRAQDGTLTQLAVLTYLNFNDDYTVPDAQAPAMPKADHIEAHAGYLFAACIREDTDGSGEQDYPSRLRWSHPSTPDAWAKDDYLDIEIGGGRITGLMSFQDHLLIFKTDSVWAMYGYDINSWQLIKMSRAIGVPSPTAVARSPIGVFMYSASGNGDVYLYNGGQPERISDNIEEALEAFPSDRIVDVWLSWSQDVLAMSVPWIAPWDPIGGTSATSSSLLVFDPYTNNGSWRMHRPAKGNVGPIVQRSDSLADQALGVLYGDDVDACLIKFGAVEAAADIIDDLVTETPFQTRYATNWKFAGTPELRKHWHRPRFIVRSPLEPFTLLFEIYRDYDESEPRRVFQLSMDSEGIYYWRDLGADDPSGDGFDWEPTDPAGRGGVWAGKTQGGRIVRGLSFGIARSVQIVISTAPATPGKSWGIDAVVLKHRDRRFTT